MKNNLKNNLKVLKAAAAGMAKAMSSKKSGAHTSSCRNDDGNEIEEGLAEYNEKKQGK